MTAIPNSSSNSVNSADMPGMVIDGIVPLGGYERLAPSAPPPRVPRLVRMSGYVPTFPRLYRLWNLALVLPLILFCLPLILVISLLLAASQGPSNIFYRGERLGLNRRTFQIIKFKTLRPEAAKVTQNQVLPSDSNLETPMGKYLRVTRLDELPQLFNVLFGDMNMLGPRPVRAPIAAKCSATIPDYDIRFAVKPGLVGYTQALMPHGADKKIRARVNGILCRRPVAPAQEFLFLAITGLSVFQWVGREARRGLRAIVGKTGQDGIPGSAVRIEDPGLNGHSLRLIGLEGDRLVVEADAPRLSLNHDYQLVLTRSFRTHRLAKSARCTGIPLSVEVVTGDAAVGCYRYTLRYETPSPLHRYLIDRYFAERCLVT